MSLMSGNGHVEGRREILYNLQSLRVAHIRFLLTPPLTPTVRRNDNTDHNFTRLTRSIVAL